MRGKSPSFLGALVVGGVLLLSGANDVYYGEYRGPLPGVQSNPTARRLTGALELVAGVVVIGLGWAWLRD